MQPFDFNNRAYPKFEGSVEGNHVDNTELNKELEEMLYAAQRRCAYLSDCLLNTEKNVYQSVEQNQLLAQNPITDQQQRTQHHPMTIKLKLKRFPNFKQILSRYGNVSMTGIPTPPSSMDTRQMKLLNNPSSSHTSSMKSNKYKTSSQKTQSKQNQGGKTVSTGQNTYVEVKEKEKQKNAEIDLSVLKNSVSYELGAPRKQQQQQWRSGGPQEQRARKNREKPRSRFCLQSDWYYKSDYTSYSDQSSSQEQILNPSSKIQEQQCSSSLYWQLPAMTMPIRPSYFDRLCDPGVHQLREKQKSYAELLKHVPRSIARPNEEPAGYNAVTTQPQEHACISDVTLPVLHSATQPSAVPAIGAQLPLYSRLGIDRRAWTLQFTAAGIPDVFCQKFLECKTTSDLQDVEASLQMYGYNLQSLFLYIHACYAGTVTSSGVMFESPEPRSPLVTQRHGYVSLSTCIASKVKKQVMTTQAALGRAPSGGFYTQKQVSMLVSVPISNTKSNTRTHASVKLDILTSSVLAAKLRLCNGPASGIDTLPIDTLLANKAMTHFPHLSDQVTALHCTDQPSSTACINQGCVYAVHDKQGGNELHAQHHKCALEYITQDKYPTFCQYCTKPVLCRDGQYTNQYYTESPCKCSSMHTYTLPDYIPKSVDTMLPTSVGMTLQPYVQTKNVSKSNSDSRIITELQLLGLFPSDLQELASYYNSTQPWQRKDDEISAAIRQTQEELGRIAELNDARKLALHRAVFHRLERKMVLGSSDQKTTMDTVEQPQTLQQIARNTLLQYRKYKKDKFILDKHNLKPLQAFLKFKRALHTSVVSGYQAQPAATSGVLRRLVKQTSHAYPSKLSIDAQGYHLHDSMQMTMQVGSRPITVAVMPMTAETHPIQGDSFLTPGSLVTTAILRDIPLADTVRGYTEVYTDNQEKKDEEIGNIKKKRKLNTVSKAPTDYKQCVPLARDWWTLEQPSIGVHEEDKA